MDAGEPADTLGELGVGLGGVDGPIAARPVEAAGGVDQPGESPFGLFIGVGRHGSGAVVVIVERHVAALGLHHGKAAENRHASDGQNAQAHHRLPIKVRISYAWKPAAVAVRLGYAAARQSIAGGEEETLARCPCHRAARSLQAGIDYFGYIPRTVRHSYDFDWPLLCYADLC